MDGAAVRHVARLRMGPSPADGRAAAGRRARRDTIFTVVAFADEITRAIRPSFLAVAGAVSLMLLVACVNVTNLLLARGTRRRAEFTMREIGRASCRERV